VEIDLLNKKSAWLLLVTAAKFEYQFAAQRSNKVDRQKGF
jgi:hypothetical protein